MIHTEIVDTGKTSWFRFQWSVRKVQPFQKREDSEVLVHGTCNTWNQAVKALSEAYKALNIANKE